MKKIYVVQPYNVGSTLGKSLAMIIPAELVKEYKIDRSTILTLRADEGREKIIVHPIIRISDTFDKTIPTGESLGAPRQQVSSGSQ